MRTTPDALKLLQEISDAPGASGFEDAAVAVARRWCESIGHVKAEAIINAAGVKTLGMEDLQ